MPGNRKKQGNLKRRKAETQRKSFVKKLPKAFNCPFCEGTETCEVAMDFRRGCAQILCSRCREDFMTKIHALSEPIDVYNDWIDACETVN